MAFSPRRGPTARSLFGRQTRARWQPAAWAELRAFYADPISWVGLVVCTALLTYGGGAVMFWFHAIYLGEGGPAISPWLHWLIDSSFGFVGLTPAIALILPVAAHVATATAGADDTNGGRVRAVPFAVVAGCLLAMVVGPAPLFHDTFISQGTPLADKVTEMWGNGSSPTGEPYEAPMFIEMVQQIGIGVPTYIALTWLGVALARGLAAIGFPRAVRPPTETPPLA